MTVTTKSRVVDSTWAHSRNLGVDTYASYGGLVETVTGEGHNLSLLGKSDTGGDCLITKAGTVYSPGQMITGNWTGSDYFVTNPSGGAFAATSQPSDLTLKGKGTTAIARTDPTNPVFDASTAIGELYRDGLPKLFGVETWKDRTKLHRGGSSEFLNYQFGWVPLVSDMRSLAYAAINQHKILADYRRGAGKNTRVGYHFPSNTRNGFAAGAISTRTQSGISLGNQNGSRWTREEYDEWFKGSFTYYLPLGNDAFSRAERHAIEARKLLGVRLDPEVVWNLTPWSWATDWFLNTGDIIHNFSALGNDSLVLKYGYMMSRRKYTVETILNGSSSATPGRSLYTSYFFRRIKASPYFGFNATAALSATQSAILVALGINHMR
uniref:Assembly protein n=3 Tax=Leviviricetes TaxID=2842243 RepID=A0A514D4W3_9VIRU|nr:MAG: hypothetical protein H2RhizoLitter491699_000004 [Leviviridae sp.]